MYALSSWRTAAPPACTHAMWRGQDDAGMRVSPMSNASARPCSFSRRERSLLSQRLSVRDRRCRLAASASSDIASAASPSSPSSSSSSSSVGDAGTSSQGPPTITLEFVPSTPPAEGQPATQEVSVASGEKVLRNIMKDNKIELYALYGKVMNCGGGGTCGTCIVEILEGGELLSEVTRAEEKYLKKKPSSWRLACQVIVGDKSNSGKVRVQQMPQTLKK